MINIFKAARTWLDIQNKKNITTNSLREINYGAKK